MDSKIIDLNIKHKAIILLRRKNRRKSWELGLDTELLYMTLKIDSQEIKVINLTSSILKILLSIDLVNKTKDKHKSKNNMEPTNYSQDSTVKKHLKRKLIKRYEETLCIRTCKDGK